MDKPKEICSRQKTVSPFSAPPGSEGTGASGGEPHLQVPWAPVTPTSTAWSDTAADNVQSSRVPFSKDNFMILPSASSPPCRSVTHPSQKQTLHPGKPGQPSPREGHTLLHSSWWQRPLSVLTVQTLGKTTALTTTPTPVRSLLCVKARCQSQYRPRLEISSFLPGFCSPGFCLSHHFSSSRRGNTPRRAELMLE